jgi:antitoxin ParD1/3/4
MNVSLTPELELMVNEKVQSGLYNSASEVIRDGLRLLKEQDDLKKTRLDELRREVQKGLSQLERGEYKTFSSAAELIENVKVEGRKRLAEKKKKATK